MIDESTFWVVTIGRKYVRSEDGIVGQKIEHAMKLTEVEAVECATRMAERGRLAGNKKPIRIYKVSVSELKLPDWLEKKLEQ